MNSNVVDQVSTQQRYLDPDFVRPVRAPDDKYYCTSHVPALTGEVFRPLSCEACRNWDDQLVAIPIEMRRAHQAWLNLKHRYTMARQNALYTKNLTSLPWENSALRALVLPKRRVTFNNQPSTSTAGVPLSVPGDTPQGTVSLTTGPMLSTSNIPLPGPSTARVADISTSKHSSGHNYRKGNRSTSSFDVTLSRQNQLSDQNRTSGQKSSSSRKHPKKTYKTQKHNFSDVNCKGGSSDTTRGKHGVISHKTGTAYHQRLYFTSAGNTR